VSYRDESGVETFRLFRGKTEMEWKYGNGILRNGNGNKIPYTKAEMETEQRFPAERTRKRNLRFRLKWNICFMIDLLGQSNHLGGSICDLLKVNRLSNSSHTP
jgi:hypothetical protein